MIYLKPNCFLQDVVPTELILFFCLFSTNISFLTELCYVLITQQIGQMLPIDIYSPPPESIRKRGGNGRNLIMALQRQA